MYKESQFFIYGPQRATNDIFGYLFLFGGGGGLGAFNDQNGPTFCSSLLWGPGEVLTSNPAIQKVLDRKVSLQKRYMYNKGTK